MNVLCLFAAAVLSSQFIDPPSQPQVALAKDTICWVPWRRQELTVAVSDRVARAGDAVSIPLPDFVETYGLVTLQDRVVVIGASKDSLNLLVQVVPLQRPLKPSGTWSISLPFRPADIFARRRNIREIDVVLVPSMISEEHSPLSSTLDLVSGHNTVWVPDVSTNPPVGDRGFWEVVAPEDAGSLSNSANAYGPVPSQAAAGTCWSVASSRGTSVVLVDTDAGAVLAEFFGNGRPRWWRPTSVGAPLPTADFLARTSVWIGRELVWLDIEGKVRRERFTPVSCPPNPHGDQLVWVEAGAIRPRFRSTLGRIPADRATKVRYRG